MADLRITNYANSSPNSSPGSLFYPSEEQLMSYYLTNKNSDQTCSGIDVIKEVDLYRYNPFDLPETACFRFGKEGRRGHWYCYVRRLNEEPRLRAAGNGYWREKDGKKNVIGGGAGRVVLGTRKTFVFYLGNVNSTAARTTEWVMHEYELAGHPKDAFVLCRVFVKFDPGNNISERESTPFCLQYAATELRLGVQQENVATVHHSDLHGAVTDEANEDNAITEQAEGSSMQELVDFFKDDFVELNDLTWPPPGFH